MATAIRGRPEGLSGDLEVGFGLSWQGMDLAEHLKRMEVEQGAYQLLSEGLLSAPDGAGLEQHGP